MARAEQAEAREKALRAKVAELTALVYGDSSEQRNGSFSGDDEGGGSTGDAGSAGEEGEDGEGAVWPQSGGSRGGGRRRGQQPGKAGHGRRGFAPRRAASPV